MQIKISLYLFPTDQGGRYKPIFSGWQARYEWEDYPNGQLTPHSHLAEAIFDGELAPGSRNVVTITPFLGVFWYDIKPNEVLHVCEDGKEVGIATFLCIIPEY